MRASRRGLGGALGAAAARGGSAFDLRAVRACVSLLTPMCTCAVRPIRHTATLGAMELGCALSKAASELEKKLEQASRALDATKERAGAGAGGGDSQDEDAWSAGGGGGRRGRGTAANAKQKALQSQADAINSDLDQARYGSRALARSPSPSPSLSGR